MKLKLLEASIEHKEAYIDYINEWEDSGEDIVPAASKRDGMSYEELLKNWKENKGEEVIEKGFVPATLYFLIGESERILGALHFRHRLNDELLHSGGHIGYGVRSSERNRGLAGNMLDMALEMIKCMEYNRVLITCNDKNTASAKTIEKNGGILEDVVEVEGELNIRYWINLR